MTKPIVRWAGGKTELLPELVARMPKTYGRYYEPFAGGAALFFHLEPERAVLNDMNAALVEAYTATRDHTGGLIRSLERHRAQHSAKHFTRVRRRWNEEAGVTGTMRGNMPTAVALRAAAFLYLNKTCFNGLWRENAAGKFNVPMGRIAKPKICDADKLRDASRVLSGTVLLSGSWEDAIHDATDGDFIYFDPPYDETWTGYTASKFGEIEQAQLAAHAWQLAQRGVCVMLSNNDTKLVRRLYKRFRIDRVTCSRAINSNAAKRGKVGEVIITAGYPRPQKNYHHDRVKAVA